MSAAWLKSLLVVGVGLLASAHAHAQPLVAQDQSIDCIVANADLVFIAKLTAFGDGKRGEGEGREVHEATIDIEQTLKQELFTYEPYKKLRIDITASESVLADWKKRSCRLLVAHDNDAPKATKVIELTEDKLHVWKADLTLLRKPDAVIQAAKEAIKRTPASVRRIHTFGLMVPRELAAGTQWEKYYHTSGHLVVRVPVDAQLEKMAQDYVRSKADSSRAEAARALRYFKSDENIARVKALLNDPAREVRYLGPVNQVMEAFYYVRYEAYDTLKAWEVEVPKPVVREEVRK